MSEQNACTSNLSLRDNVSHFLEHLEDYSEEQTTGFIKSIYAASQNRIRKGRKLVANDLCPSEEDLSRVVEETIHKVLMKKQD